MSYNGFRNWNQWNVSLWINNDEALYRRAKVLCSVFSRRKAAERFLTELPDKTPDGATYNVTSLLAAFAGL